MEDSEMGFDDEVSLPDESWSCGWEDDGEDNEEDEMEVTDGMDALEISDTHRALRYIEENGLEFLRLDDCIERLREQQREQEEIKRQSHHRVTDLWTTTWGRMLQSPQLNVPTSWEHRVFMRRFRLPYQLFKQLVAECVEVNLFKQKRPGKIPVEFKVLIGLRILGRDSCADDLDEALNIGGSTINNIFKLFITGCATMLYHRHVRVPEGEELDKIVETYT
ncbi:hypothetical protein B484DRAFT_439391, partial [Ochromonadaceae sp. CCMP2298]